MPLVDPLKCMSWWKYLWIGFWEKNHFNHIITTIGFGVLKYNGLLSFTFKKFNPTLIWFRLLSNEGE